MEKADKTKVIREGSVIVMSYSITNKEGRILEARSPENPIQVLVGHGQILNALEKKIIGESEGFKGDFHFVAKEAHGEYKKELLVEMDKEKFPEDVEVKKGMKFESQGPNGEVVPLHVVDVQGDRVLIDGNHPLAGEDLTFDVNILEVRQAAKEELAQGRALNDMEVSNKTIH